MFRIAPRNGILAEHHARRSVEHFLFQREGPVSAWPRFAYGTQEREDECGTTIGRPTSMMSGWTRSLCPTIRRPRC